MAKKIEMVEMLNRRGKTRRVYPEDVDIMIAQGWTNKDKPKPPKK